MTFIKILINLAFGCLLYLQSAPGMEAPKKDKTVLYIKEISGSKIPGFLKLLSYPRNEHQKKYKLKYLNAKKQSIGYCKFYYYDDNKTACIDMLYISTDYRNKACGSVLLQNAQNELLAKDVIKIIVMAVPDKDKEVADLVRFYSRCGFKVKEYRGNYAKMKYKNPKTIT